MLQVSSCSRNRCRVSQRYPSGAKIISNIHYAELRRKIPSADLRKNDFCAELFMQQYQILQTTGVEFFRNGFGAKSNSEHRKIIF